jgi:diacylglycerol kinase (ATP)
MSKQAIFIVNPASGTNDDQTEIVNRICLEAKGYAVTLWNTTGNNDEQKILELLQPGNFDLIIVGGGDGTIKMVASQMKGLQIPLLPVPFGSANGLCSCLGIETWEDSLSAMQSGNLIQMDVLDVNGELCLHICDFGFNAGLIKRFEENDQRGMMGYFKSSLSQVFENNKYTFTISLHDEIIEVKAKMLVIANGDRYGTGAKINPKGKLDDGKFEIVVLNPDSVKEWTTLTLGFIKEDFSDLEFVRTYSTKSVVIENPDDAEFHIDGEIKEQKGTVAIKLSERKIRIYSNFTSKT